MQPFETYEHAGVTVELYYDDSAFNPREDFDHAGTIVSFTREFDGDEYLNVDEDLTIECPSCKGSGEDQAARCSRCDGEGAIDATVSEYLRAINDAEIVIPLRFSDYGSSGAQLYEVGENGDRGRDANAAIYIDAEIARKEWGTDRDKVRAYLLSEVKEMDAYLNGEVYGYVIKDATGNDLPAKMHDSCWGFIGDVKYVTEEANSAAEDVAEQLAKETTECAEMAERDIITVDN